MLSSAAAHSRSLSSRLPKFPSSLTLLSPSSALAYLHDYPDDTPSEGPSHPQIRHLVQSGHLSAALHLLTSTSSNPSINDYNSLIYSFLKSPALTLPDLSRVYTSLQCSNLPPNALTYTALLNGLLSLNSLTDALHLINEMHSNGYMPSFRSLSKLLKALLRLNEFRDSVHVVDFMLFLDYTPSDAVLSELIRRLAGVGMLEEACRVLKTLIDMGRYCAPFVYNPVLWGLCKGDCGKMALSVLCCVMKRGFGVNVCSYTAFVYGFTVNGLWDEVGRVLRGMKSLGCKANVITYTIMLKRYWDVGRNDEALRVLDRMEKERCEFDVVVYNVSLRVLSHWGRVNELCGKVSFSVKNGSCLDAYSYTTIAGGLLKMGKKEIARDVLAHGILGGCVMDAGGYNLYIHMLCLRNKLREAVDAVRKMREEDLRPNDISYHTILFAACKAENSSAIDWVFKMMVCQGIKHNVVSLTCLAKYFCSKGEPSKGLMMLDYMLQYGITPSTITLNVLIHGLCKKQMLGAAQQFRTCFRNMGSLPDVVTYNILLHAALRARADVLAGEFLKEMNREGVKPNMVTIGILINSRCKMGKISDAFEIANMMLDHGVVPGNSIYNSYLNAMLRRGKAGDAVNLLRHMIRHGGEPDIVSVANVERAISKGRLKNSPLEKELLKLVKSSDAGPFNTTVTDMSNHSNYCLIVIHLWKGMVSVPQGAV